MLQYLYRYAIDIAADTREWLTGTGGSLRACRVRASPVLLGTGIQLPPASFSHEPRANHSNTDEIDEDTESVGAQARSFGSCAPCPRNSAGPSRAQV